MGYSTLSLHRLFWFVWRWEVQLRDGTSHAGVRLGRANARRAARAVIRNTRPSLQETPLPTGTAKAHPAQAA
ncbi:MAG: hypothetical protein JWO72_1372 [Caulobacteraceae bacterium]|nr:hypothetical protein [Caulobacteraceae bacterium]